MSVRVKKLFVGIVVVFLIISSVLCGYGCEKHAHIYTQNVIAPTCEKNGFTIKKCDCGYEEIFDYVDKLGHSFGEYVSDNNASYVIDGTKTAKCTRNGCLKTNTIYDNGSKLKYKVKFYYDTSSEPIIQEVESGKRVSVPIVPQKTNYIFMGWSEYGGTNIYYDFSKSVTKDFSLYAYYELDAVTITNKISTDTIKGVVKIYNKCYNSFLGIETGFSTSLGSGFCFRINNGRYYVITNCHTAINNTNYDNQEFTIVDYQGKEYVGYLYKSPAKTSSAISAAYDLAVLYFKPSSTNVKKLDLATNNPKIQSDVVLLGSPAGQANSITYGNVSGHQNIKLSNCSTRESNVTFPVIISNAYANSGSSGGPLLNSNLKVVGVHYAGNRTKGYSFAIPIEKVREFLNKYFYS